MENFCALSRLEVDDGGACHLSNSVARS